jgi:DNA polymerase-1
MKTRTLIIDGSYLLKRSFHGAKDIYTNSFGHLGGLYQFMTTLRKLTREHMINKTIICWDGEGGGIYRHRIDAAYKANRKTKEWHKKIEMTASELRREKEKEESILKQRKRIQAYAEELFIRQIEVDDIEADDLIASYCLEHNNKEEIYLYSNDRDFAQLLDLNITIIFPNINQPVNKTNYIMHFNHHYSNALILKIICGDTADNIKGIAGMGEKTLLEHFPELKFKHLSVRDICKRADEINQERVLNKMKPLKSLQNLISPEGVERLKTNFKLVNLREPMLNEVANEELKQLEIPLSPDGRGSKNLLKMMNEDDFLSVYGSTFVQYVEPFYTIIMNEKQLLTEYIKNNRKQL